MKISVGMVIMGSTFAAVFGMCYAVLNWMGEPCPYPIFTEGTVTITDASGEILSSSQMRIRTCQQEQKP